MKVKKGCAREDEYLVFALDSVHPKQEVEIVRFCRKAKCNAGVWTAKNYWDNKNNYRSQMYVCIDRDSPVAATFRLKHDVRRVKMWPTNAKFTIYVKDEA